MVRASKASEGDDRPGPVTMGGTGPPRNARLADVAAVRQGQARPDTPGAPPRRSYLDLPDDADLTGPSLRERISQIGTSTDGTAHDDGLVMLDEIDRVAAFSPAILAIRWGTTAVSLALASPELRDANPVFIAWSIVLVAYTIFRTVRPIRYLGNIRSLVAVIGEVALHVLMVGSTDFWDSPFVFSLLTAVIVAGFARGFGFSLRIGTAAAIAVSLPYLVDQDVTSETVRISAQWTVSLLLIAVVAGYARRISGEADRQHSLALDRLGRLADANALLFSLHRVTQTLPASLDLDDVLDNTIGRLRNLFDFEAVAILALDDTDTSWDVIRREGVRLPHRVAPVELAPPLQRALAERTVVAVDDLQGNDGPGLSGRSGSGMYAVLPARGSIIGLLAIEARAEQAFTPRDLELLRGFVEPVALAIDNARWFSRLRTVGADEERTRIARDLHDRIGQSLAYLAFELDRIVSRNAEGEEVSDSLEQLRGDVRGVIGEVRDTLYDLRTDVTEDQGFAAVIDNYAQRVRERTSLDITVSCDREARLPILQEREMWRIAQEAITNVERHAKASELSITWRCDGESALLEISDDGTGFPIGTAGRMDSYGILGMRERASSIGATFEIQSQESKGTVVRCHLAAT